MRDAAAEQEYEEEAERLAQLPPDVQRQAVAIIRRLPMIQRLANATGPTPASGPTR